MWIELAQVDVLGEMAQTATELGPVNVPVDKTSSELT